MYLIHAFRFLIIFLYRKVLCQYCDFLNWLHFRLTSRRSTDDAFREMILEQIRFRHRKTEQKCYHLWCEMFLIGIDLGVDVKQPISSPEKIRHSVKDFENE